MAMQKFLFDKQDGIPMKDRVGIGLKDCLDAVEHSKELARHFRDGSLRDDKTSRSLSSTRSDVRVTVSSLTASKGRLSWRPISILGGIVPKQENGQIVETAIEARGAERGTQCVGLEPGSGGGGVRGDLFRVV